MLGGARKRSGMKCIFAVLLVLINAEQVLAASSLRRSQSVAAFATPSVPPSDPPPPPPPPSNPPSSGPPSGTPPQPVYRYPPGTPQQPSYPGRSLPSYPSYPGTPQPSSGMPPILSPPSAYPPILSPPESSYEPIQPIHQPPYPSEQSYPSGPQSFYDESRSPDGPPDQSDLDPSQRPIFPQDTYDRNQGPNRYAGERSQGPRYPGEGSQGPRYPGDRNQGPRYPGERRQGPRYPGDRNQGPRYPGDRNQGPRYPGGRNQGPRYPGDRNQGPRYPGDRNQGPRYPGDRGQGLSYPGGRNQGPGPWYPQEGNQGQRLGFPQDRNQGPPQDRRQGPGPWSPQDRNQGPGYPPTSIPPDPSLPYGGQNPNEQISYPATSYPSSPFQSPSFPPVAVSPTSYTPIESTGASGRSRRSSRPTPKPQDGPPSPPISMPVWSLACPILSSGETSMNIVTFATAVSLGPPKLWMVSLYNNTLTRNSFLESKVGILQLLSSSMPDLVPVLGQRSGYEEGFSKRRECRNLIHSWVSSDFEFPAKDGTTSTLDLLPECALYMQLRLLSTTEAGDHDMALCEVIGTGVWNQITKKVVATDSFPTAFDPVRVLYTQQLRDERII